MDPPQSALRDPWHCWTTHHGPHHH